jgi:hypothetical protein
MGDQGEAAGSGPQAAQATVDVGADREDGLARGLRVGQDGERALAPAIENGPGW